MNDNDALEEELGEPKKIEPVQNPGLQIPAIAEPVSYIKAQIHRPDGMFEKRNAVIKDSPKNK